MTFIDAARPLIITTADEIESYKRGRAARINLIKKDKTFSWWLDWANAVVSARHEAMRRAYINQPIGTAYNAAHVAILRREKLHLSVDGLKETPEEKNTRKDAVAMIDNMDRPIDIRRRKSVREWRQGLDPAVQARLNHPTSIMRRWKSDTEPVDDKIAKQAGVKDKADDTLRDALADADGERAEAQRHSESLRALLGRVLDEVEDLGPQLRSDIEAALR